MNQEGSSKSASSFRSELYFFERFDTKVIRALSDLCDERRSILIVDRKVLRSLQAKGSRSVLNWLAGFSFVLKVKAGEDLKSIAEFQRALNQIDRAVGQSIARSWTVVALGGGSVGDFAGFLASVYKRGLELIHIPSTWLAAIDSAHGGKTALNGLGAKNQIGTFYPAKSVVLIKEILSTQSDRHVRSAMGEYAKALLLAREGSQGFAPHDRSIDQLTLRRNVKARVDQLWAALPTAIEVKMEFVDLDPYERTGERFALNLGHTFGHCVESHTGIAHGLAVGIGLRFMLDVSLDQKRLSSDEHLRLNQFLDRLDIPTRAEALRWLKKRPLSRAALHRLLLRDKKATGTKQTVRFVVLDGPGRYHLVSLSAKDLVAIAVRFGWIK